MLAHQNRRSCFSGWLECQRVSRSQNYPVQFSHAILTMKLTDFNTTNKCNIPRPLTTKCCDKMVIYSSPSRGNKCMIKSVQEP